MIVFVRVKSIFKSMSVKLRFRLKSFQALSNKLVSSEDVTKLSLIVKTTR